MAHTKGLVVRIKEKGWATVATEKKSACGGCGAAQDCRPCLSKSKMVAEVLNGVGAKEGDLVTVSLDSSALLKSAALMYLTPVVGLMAGALIGASVSVDLPISETVAAIVFAFIGLCLGSLMIAYISSRMSKNEKFTPTISKIIKPSAERAPFSLPVDPSCKMKICSENNY